MIKSDGGGVGDLNFSNVKDKCHYKGSHCLREPRYPMILEKKGGGK